MNSHWPDILSHMVEGDEEGDQDVPDPICPTNMTFFSVPPTRTPMSVPDITSNGPVFIGPMPGMFSIAPGDAPGLAEGMGIFMF